MIPAKPAFEGHIAIEVSKKRKRGAEQEYALQPPTMTGSKALSRSDYTIGWISALPLEMAAAKAMLDVIHPRIPNLKSDDNSYVMGSIGLHNVVIACMPAGVYGTTSATAVATHMYASFPSIRFGLMVGIGGGAPQANADIRLGDVVVSVPTESFGGVVQYDYGKTVQEGHFKRTGTLNKPPGALLKAISQLRAEHDIEPSHIPEHLASMAVKYPTMVPDYSQLPDQADQLFEADYEHIESEPTCDRCDLKRTVARVTRTDNFPVIHYGLIASANQVMKHAVTRDRLVRELGVLCFEMEAGGLMDNFPCLVVRGICDYSDSHKNKQWQRYAAATAAAYAKELLSFVPAYQDHATKLLESLRFPDMNKRKADISYNHAGTFEWILKGESSDSDNSDDEADDSDNEADDSDDEIDDSDEEVEDSDNEVDDQSYEDTVEDIGFVEWLINSDDNYWICGKAGSGKSTLMRFIVEHESSQSYLTQWASGRKLSTVEAYIWNAGSELQKSYKGVLATLLFQLLEQADAGTLDSLIHNQGQYKRESIADWHTRDVEECILTLLTNSTQCFCLFIDGLDELEVRRRSEDDEIFLRFVDRISALPNVKCCVSSRPEQLFEVFFKATRKLRLENLNNGDIRQLCLRSLKQGFKEAHRNLDTPELERLRYLVNAFVVRASGVFLWAHLVLRQIRRGIRAGDEISELYEYLNSLPSEISKLYEHMWTRNNDDLLRHREEAANFINLVLLYENFDSRWFKWPGALNPVQLALMFDQRFRNNHKASLNLDDVIKASIRVKERVSVRTAGLLHVVDNDASSHSSYNDLDGLRKSRIQFIHRTARDFLLTEPVGHKIRAAAPDSADVLVRRFLRISMQEVLLSRKIVAESWLATFLRVLRRCDEYLRPSETTDFVDELEKTVTYSVQKHLKHKGVDDVFCYYFMHRPDLRYCSFNHSFPLDFNAWLVEQGMSSSILNSVRCTSSRLNPEYCAYLLCSFGMFFFDHHDHEFHQLVSLLLEQLQPTMDGAVYVQCTVPYYPSPLHPDTHSGFSYLGGTLTQHHDRGPQSRSGVRRSVCRKLVEFIFGRRRDPSHFHQTLPLVISFLNAPHLSSVELLVLQSFSEKWDVHWPEISSMSYDFGLLIEYDLRELLRWYLRNGQIWDRRKGEVDWSDHMKWQPKGRWNNNVRAIVQRLTTMVGYDWRKPSPKDCNAISAILSRLPPPPLYGGDFEGFRYDVHPDGLEVKKLLALVEEVWKNSPRQDELSMLKELEYMIPSDDPRVLKRAPPMFLDEPVSEAGRQESEGEEDEFFDAVE